MKIGILTRKLTSNTNVDLNAIPFTYLNIFNKDYYPEIDIAIKMAKYFNCSLDYLFGLTDNILYYAAEALCYLICCAIAASYRDAG